MARWYIGKERAEMLLDYALARLSMHAHRLEPKQYLLLRKFLEARIPMWVEERRGPVDRQGKPLLSENGYKDFIAWWVTELTKARIPATEEEPVNKQHFAEEIFGNTKTATAGASALKGGMFEDLLAEYTDLGPDKNAALKGFFEERIAAYFGPFAGSPAELQKLTPAITALRTLFYGLIDQWTQNESLSPRDPVARKAFITTPSPVGINEMDQLRRAMDEMLYEIITQKAVVGGTSTNLGWWNAYGQATPSVSMPGNLIPADRWTAEAPYPTAYPASAVRSYSQQTWNPDPMYEVPVTQETTLSSFAGIYGASAGPATFALSLVGLGKPYASFVEAKSAVEDYLAGWPQGQTSIATGARGEVVDSASYNSLVTAFEAYVRDKVGL